MIAYSDHAINLLTLLSFKGYGRAWANKNLMGGESEDDIVSLIQQCPSTSKGTEQVSLEDFRMQKLNVVLEVNKLDGHIDGIVALGDDHFPDSRAKKEVNASERPLVLFYKGDLSLLERSNPTVTVIGLLKPDEKIEQAERMVVKRILEEGATIVSGLALGCDTIAHDETLRGGGKTIAILPSSLNDILPASNKDLAQRIVDQGGLLITEYYNGVKSRQELSTRYIERDRLQALYADHILLSASYGPNKEGLDCGSRHAMEKARKYGIPRYVIYNESKHRDNRMYELNRIIAHEDRSVCCVDSTCLDSVVKQMFEASVPTTFF